MKKLLYLIFYTLNRHMCIVDSEIFRLENFCWLKCEFTMEFAMQLSSIQMWFSIEGMFQKWNNLTEHQQQESGKDE